MTTNPHRRHTHPYRAFLLAALLLCGLFAGCAETKNLTVSDEWHIISIAGSPIGYVHSVTRERNTPPHVFVTNEFAKTRLSRLGTIIEHDMTSEYIESPDGKLLFASTVSRLGATETHCRAKVKGNNLSIETTIAGKTSARTIPLDHDIIGPYAQLRRIRNEALEPGASLTFQTFVPEFKRIVTTTLKIEGTDTITLNGALVSLWHGTMTQDILPGIITKVWIDNNGSIARSHVNLMGGMETRRSTETQALCVVAPSHIVDIMDKFFIPSNREIRSVYTVTEALYRLEAPQGTLKQLNFADRRQTIEKRGPGWILLRVRAIGDTEKPTAKRPHKTYLASTLYLQSDDPEIKELARKACGDAKTPAEKTARLKEWVYKHIRKKDFGVGFASAKEVVVSRRGDCTEHAVLLAALLRAEGIPSRLAVGLVYYQNNFGYHMWTEAFLNNWTAVDAAFNQTIVDATHIKLKTTALPGASATNPFTDILTIIGNLKLTIEELEN